MKQLKKDTSGDLAPRISLAASDYLASLPIGDSLCEGCPLIWEEHGQQECPTGFDLDEPECPQRFEYRRILRVMVEAEDIIYDIIGEPHGD